MSITEYKQKRNQDIKDILNQEFDKQKGVKYTLAIQVAFVKIDSESSIKGWFWSSTVRNATVIIDKSNIQESIDSYFDDLQNQIDKFVQNGSGWVLERVIEMELHVVKYRPLKDHAYIQLPKEIELKHACVNIKNDDDKCFAYAVLSAIHIVDRNNNPNDVRHYRPHLDGIEYARYKVSGKYRQRE